MEVLRGLNTAALRQGRTLWITWRWHWVRRCQTPQNMIILENDKLWKALRNEINMDHLSWPHVSYRTSKLWTLLASCFILSFQGMNSGRLKEVTLVAVDLWLSSYCLTNWCLRKWTTEWSSLTARVLVVWDYPFGGLTWFRPIGGILLYFGRNCIHMRQWSYF